jgi:murein DD-endopeptidase MepM/ murein hydrolase activator NlpD
MAMLCVAAILAVTAGQGCTPLGRTSGALRTSGSGAGVYHTVQKGETLWRISRTYGVSVAEVTEANGLSSYDIRVGQKLLIPGATRRLAVRVPGSATREEQDVPASAEGRLTWPLAGRGRGSVTSGFGPRKSPGGGSTFHKGIDIDGVREERVLAAAAGEVVFAGRMSGFGNVVMIDHGGRLITVYGHLSRSVVRLEERVSQGQTVGYVGTTGTSTGSHLHFEVRYKGVSVDPLRYLP